MRILTHPKAITDMVIELRNEANPRKRTVIGMVHLGPLPGSVRFAGNLDEVISNAKYDAEALQTGGVDGIMVENFFDSPFHRSELPPVTIAAMTRAVLAVQTVVRIPVGVNALRNDIVSAISIAAVAGAEFVRCNIYVGAMVTDQGLIQGAAREAQEARARLASTVQIWADVAVKHAVSLGHYPIGDQAKDAVHRGLADALIISGTGTGQETSLDDVIAVRNAVPDCPILIGSGLSRMNAKQLFKYADGAIVGSAFKQDGQVNRPISVDRVREIVAVSVD